MRIIVSAKSFVPDLGGTINYARMLSRAFREEGHDVSVITRTAEGPDEVDGVPVFRNPGWRKKSEFASEADVLLQVESSWQDALPFLLKGVHWYPTLHRGYTPVSIFRPKEWIQMMLERAAFHLGRTISVSDFSLRSWNVRGERIGSSYEDSKFTPPADGSVRDIDLIFIGRMTYDKGALVLIDAIEQIARNEPGLIKRVRLAGDGPALDDLRQRCDALSGSLDIAVTGALTTCEEVAAHLRRSRILVFPTTSRWLESSPIVPLEGLACGCFVVASDIGGTRENIGPKGFLVPPDDAEALAQMLTRVIKEQPSFNEADVRAFLATRGATATARRYLDLFEKNQTMP
jgi:glycosyltransferase involved in cell wall biosynthesis